jgi:hypothetical protein
MASWRPRRAAALPPGRDFREQVPQQIEPDAGRPTASRRRIPPARLYMTSMPPNTASRRTQGFRNLPPRHRINYSIRNVSRGRRKMKQLVPARPRHSLMDHPISSALG